MTRQRPRPTGWWLRDGSELHMTRVGHASGCVQNLKCDYVAVCIEIQDNAQLVLVALGDRGVLEDDSQCVGVGGRR